MALNYQCHFCFLYSKINTKQKYYCTGDAQSWPHIDFPKFAKCLNFLGKKMFKRKVIYPYESVIYRYEPVITITDQWRQSERSFLCFLEF